MFYVFSFPPAVYVETLNLIASIPDPYILTFHAKLISRGGGGGGGGGGHSLVSSVPMRDQRIVEHTLNSVIDI